MTLKLSVPDVKKLSSLRPTYSYNSILNIALVLCGGRAACRCEDDTYRGPGFEQTIQNMFGTRIGVLNTPPEPIFYRIGAVNKTDIDTVTKRTTSKAQYHKTLHKLFGYTGTAYPCNVRKDTILIRWTMISPTGTGHMIAEHCAKPKELQACFSAFRRMRDRVTGLMGIKFADFELKKFNISAEEFV
jgi:hypothetical protein